MGLVDVLSISGIDQKLKAKQSTSLKLFHSVVICACVMKHRLVGNTWFNGADCRSVRNTSMILTVAE